jgi:hypothetical protein
MAKTKTPKRTADSPSPSASPPFFAREDGSADRCFFCVKLDPGAAPLLHPAILIPTAPVGKPMKVGDRKLVEWHWDMVKVCIPHARMYLNDIKDDELNPKVERDS